MTAFYLISAAFIVLLPWMTARRFGLVVWVSPLHFVAYFAFFGVFAKTILALFAPDMMLYSSFIDDEAAVVGGYLYVLCFMVFLCLGYVLGIRRRAAPDFAHLSKLAVAQIRSPRLLMLIGIGIFLLAALALVAARGIGGFAAIFSVETIHSLNSSKIVRTESGVGQSFAALKAFFIVPTLVLLVALARQIIAPTLGNFLLLLVLATTVLFSILMEAKRLDLLNLLFYYLCITVLMGNRVDGRSLLKLFAASFGVIGLFIVMTTLRATKGGLEGLEVAVLEPLLHITGSTYFLDINVPIMIIDRLPDLPPLLGESYTYWLYGWIPRDLWPEKPVVSLGPYVKQEVMGLYGSVGGINPTGAGEAMLNFGWAGMLVGAGLGLLYRWLEEALLRPKTFVVYGGIWLYPLVFFPFIVATLQSSFSASLVTSAFNVALLTILLKLVSIRWRVGGPPLSGRAALAVRGY
jgi:hypothetical protein